MQTGWVRRVLADATGFTTLAAFVIVFVAVLLGVDRGIREWPTVVGVYGVLGIISYKSWIELERTGAKGSLTVLISMGLALAFLPIDVLLGRWVHSELSLVDSTVSSLSFWLTLLICPLLTAVFLAGWARSAVLGGRVPTP
jgi:hypothetical protein